MSFRPAAALLALSVVVALAAGLGHAASTAPRAEPQARIKHYDPLP